jgi:hypothetical protein
MDMAMFEMVFNQSAGLKSTCVSIEWLGWLLLGRPKGRRRSHNAVSMDRWPPEKASPWLRAKAVYTTKNHGVLARGQTR